MSANFRRAQALSAIAAVAAGGKPDDLESELVDFKEEAGTVDRTGARVGISPQHEPAAQALAGEVGCVANTESGGVLVVGVNDRAAGPAAFVGTYLDVEWLRRRIHALTQPSLSIDEIEIVYEHGARLYLINVAPALEEIRVGTKLRTRFGKDCVELTGDQAREFLESRRGYDWSAEPSGMRLSSATKEALESARTHYRAARGTAPPSDQELARRMGVTLGSPDDADPELNRAGALLLCPFEPNVEQLRVLITVNESAPSRDSLRGAAPLLPLLDQARALIDNAFPATFRFEGAHRVETRPVSERALREALVNALVHRDYRLPRSTVVATAVGAPADLFKVRSPGGFPSGVSADRLISTPSNPRNPALTNATRVLGLAEGEGIGIDAMYEVMLRDGHPTPSIAEDGGDVVVLLSGGNPNLTIRSYFDDLYRAAGLREGEEDVRIAIAISLLLEQAILRPEQLADAAQCTVAEAFLTLEQLERLGALARLVNRARSFRLSETARARLAGQLSYRSHRAIEAHKALVIAYLDANPEIGRDDAATLLGVAPITASVILAKLRDARVITPVANSRGAGVRYRRV